MKGFFNIQLILTIGAQQGILSWIRENGMCVSWTSEIELTENILQCIGSLSGKIF